MTVVIATAFFVSGCTSTTTTKTDNAAVVAPKDCAADVACANDLVARCAPGTFIEKSDRVTGLVTILEKKGENCILKEEVALTEFAPFANKALDKNNDGKYEINCEMPIQKDVASISKTLADNSEKYCNGELIEFGKYILQQMGQ